MSYRIVSRAEFQRAIRELPPRAAIPAEEHNIAVMQWTDPADPARLVASATYAAGPLPGRIVPIYRVHVPD